MWPMLEWLLVGSPRLPPLPHPPVDLEALAATVSAAAHDAAVVCSFMRNERASRERALLTMALDNGENE